MNKKVTAISGLIAIYAILYLFTGEVLAFILSAAASLVLAQTDERLKELLLTKVNQADVALPEIERSLAYKASATLFIVALLIGYSESTVNMPKPEGEKSERTIDRNYAEYMNSKAEALWDELMDMRYNEDFHTKRFQVNDWNDRRQALYNEWNLYTKQLPFTESAKYGIGESLYWMHLVGKQFYTHKGEIKSPSERDFKKRIEWSLENDGLRSK